MSGVRALRGKGATPIRFASDCRMSPEKGVLETLAAFERVAAEMDAHGIDAEWTCIGDGPLAAELATRAAAGPAAGRMHLPGLSPAEVAGEARAMLRLGRDEGLRRRMGAQARAVSLRFDSGRMTARLEDAMLDAFAGVRARAA